MTTKGLKEPCHQKVVTLHERMIRDLVDSHPEIYRNGFWRAVMGLAAELDYTIQQQPFLPDAYQIDRENCEIVMHEVVVSNGLSDSKLAHMGALWMDWDGEGDTDWLPRLFLHHPGFPPQEVDLVEALHGYTMPWEMRDAPALPVPA